MSNSPSPKVWQGSRSVVSANRGARGWITSHPYLSALAAAGSILGAMGFANHRLAKRAEHNNPPAGRFIDVDGVRLHFIERGQGSPVVLLHGNGSMIDDFESSGLIDLAARTHRVIVFDRPGFGHSARPRGVNWTPSAQATLLHAALMRIGVSRMIVLGHSWGASVAIALALQYPQAVNGLVLASGYYYPTKRADVAFLSVPAIPVLGDVVRYTLAPIATRLLWPALLRKMFAPAPVPAKFRRFPKEMAVRPSQLRAEAVESALLVPTAIATSAGGYGRLKMPLAIVAGKGDRLIDPEQSYRLHREITQSTLRSVAGSGHMVHQTNPEAVLSALTEVSVAYNDEFGRPARYVPEAPGTSANGKPTSGSQSAMHAGFNFIGK